MVALNYYLSPAYNNQAAKKSRI